MPASQNIKEMAARYGFTIIELPDQDRYITVSEERPDGSFGAWFNDYDLDCIQGWGMTRMAAVQDLMDKDCDLQCERIAKIMKDG